MCPVGDDDDPTEITVAPTQPVEAFPPAQVDPEADVRARDLPEGTVVGEYRIAGKIGEGSMGTVYAAVHPLIGKRAAVKVLSTHLYARPDLFDRFVKEARAVAQIGHPNIVDAYSFGTLPDGRCYFVMEWLQGRSLGDRLAAERMPFADAVDVLDQVCRALAAAHEKGIIHRDLKPENVFLVDVRGEKPRVKLLDFSIVKLAVEDEDSDRPNRTQTGVMLGTPLYMSPEQARGRGVDHRTDLYSLGVMAYEMLLGKPPFDSESSLEIVSKHLHAVPPRPSDTWPEVPPALERLLVALLAKEPEARPTLSEVRAVLAELRGVSVPMPALATAPVTRRVPWRTAVVWVVGAVLLIALGVLLAWSVMPSPF